MNLRENFNKVGKRISLKEEVSIEQIKDAIRKMKPGAQLKPKDEDEEPGVKFFLPKWKQTFSPSTPPHVEIRTTKGRTEDVYSMNFKDFYKKFKIQITENFSKSTKRIRLSEDEDKDLAAKIKTLSRLRPGSAIKPKAKETDPGIKYVLPNYKQDGKDGKVDFIQITTKERPKDAYNPNSSRNPGGKPRKLSKTMTFDRKYTLSVEEFFNKFKINLIDEDDSVSFENEKPTKKDVELVASKLGKWKTEFAQGGFPTHGYVTFNEDEKKVERFIRAIKTRKDAVRLFKVVRIFIGDYKFDRYGFSKKCKELDMKPEEIEAIKNYNQKIDFGSRDLKIA